jgi:uncharacterized protein
MDNSGTVQTVTPTKDKKPAIKWGWLRAVLQFIAWLIIYIIVSNTAVVIVAVLRGIDPMTLMGNPASLIEKLGIEWMTIAELAGLGGTLLTVWIFRKFIDRKSMLSLGFEFKPYLNDLFAGMGWGIILISIGFLALWISGMLTIQSVEFNPFRIFFYIIFFVIVALNEEILVRGYMLTNLMDSMNKYLALVLSALLFSVMHLFNPSVSLISTINIFLAGILLGIYFIHKGNLWFPIGMHFTWNFFQGPVFGFEVSGMRTYDIINHDIAGHKLITGGEFGYEGSLIATVAMIVLIVVIHLKHRER